MTTEQIELAIAAAGLAARGFVQLVGDEQSGVLAGMNSLVLIGLIGRQGWDSFASSPEALDALEHPLDRWSRRCIDDLASRLGGTPLYPFGGPPYWPFQRWAQRAERLFPSPLGLLIHPTFGLWHSYRGALAFAEKLEIEPPLPAASPCDSCAEKPCLSPCPVGAFTPTGYDVDACARWLRSGSASACMEGGCLARRACPVGEGFAHAPDQASFGMQAFLASRD